MNLIGLKKLQILKKDNYKFLLLYLLPTIAFGAVVFLLFYFSSRSTKSLFPILLAIVTDLYISYILYLSIIPFNRFVKYKRLCKEVASKPLIETDIKVISIDNHSHTIRGIKCIEVSMLDLEDEKELHRFLPIEYSDVLKIDSKYKITAFHELIVRFEEILG